MAAAHNPRVLRAMQWAGGDRARAALRLGRWARTVRGVEPELADELEIAARQLVARDMREVQLGFPSRRSRNERLKRMRAAENLKKLRARCL